MSLHSQSGFCIIRLIHFFLLPNIVLNYLKLFVCSEHWSCKWSIHVSFFDRWQNEILYLDNAWFLFTKLCIEFHKTLYESAKILNLIKIFIWNINCFPWLHNSYKISISKNPFPSNDFNTIKNCHKRREHKRNSKWSWHRI